MAAPAGTLAYRTYVTLNAPGNSNGDATTIVNAFNGVTYPYVSATGAATASASGAAVTIYWADASARLGRDLVRDYVAQQLVGLASSLNAPVTNIVAYTEINMS